MDIGGNLKAIIQTKDCEKNEYGVEKEVWNDTIFLNGFLDLLNDGYSINKLLLKVEDSTHVFVCDYQELKKDGEKVNTENSRMIIDDEIYTVKLIDNPMRMNKQLEIYLDYLGGQT